MPKVSQSPVDISPEFVSGCIAQVLQYEELGSTNLEALRLAKKGALSGTVVLARRQTRGRGRLDRTWESPEGGLYFSLLLRPPSSAPLSLLPLTAALAVASALEDYGVPARIRWPNDVLVDGKKAAGILLELETAPDATVVVIGVGLNLNVDLSMLSAEIRGQAVSLAQYCGHPFDDHEVLGVILRRFSEFYGMFCAGQSQRLRSGWIEKSDTLGKTVRIQTPEGPVEGAAVDIDANGFLLLLLPSGIVRTVTAGDCLYLREGR